MTAPDAGADRRVLREIAYPDSTNLRARSSIYAYKQPAFDVTDWVLDHADWRAGIRVLDVGCGPGTYLRRAGRDQPGLHLAGVDLSHGMASEASTAAPALVGDVGDPPFADATFGRVLAMHITGAGGRVLWVDLHGCGTCNSTQSPRDGTDSYDLESSWAARSSGVVAGSWQA